MMSTELGTPQYLHAVLKLAFDRAVAEDELMSSPVATVPRPKAPHRSERVVLSEADAGRFLGAPESHRYRAAWTRELLRAMRPGEALALHWGDVDLDAGVVHIRHTMTDSGERLAPKTQSGVRSIVLSNAARAALAAHALAAGARAQDNLVFTTSTRRHEHPRNVRRSFEALCEKLAYDAAYKAMAEALGITVDEPKEPQRVEARTAADAQPGFTTMTMYELRHSCASLLLSRGESVTAVSQMLGHKSAKTTLQFCARAARGLREAGGLNGQPARASDRLRHSAEITRWSFRYRIDGARGGRIPSDSLPKDTCSRQGGVGQ